MFKGERLRDLRLESEKTQAEVAKYCGTSQGGIGNFENNRRDPSKDMVLKFCELFGVQESFFYDNQEIDIVRERINELRRQGLLKKPEDVKGHVADLILEAVRSDLMIYELRKGQGD